MGSGRLRLAGCVFVSMLVSPAAGQPAGKEPAPEPTFPAVRFVSPSKLLREGVADYDEFTLAGPKGNTHKPLPKDIRHIAYDPASKQMYGISRNRVVRVDIAKGETTEMKLPAHLPELSHPCGITFDTKRERVVLVSLGGVGHMYSFTPKTGDWALICDMRDVDVVALTYDAKADRLYGLCIPYRGETHNVRIFNAVGAVVERIELTDPVFPADFALAPISRPLQLVVVGGDLAIIAEDRIFAVDLKTTKMRVTWTRK